MGKMNAQCSLTEIVFGLSAKCSVDVTIPLIVRIAYVSVELCGRLPALDAFH